MVNWVRRGDVVDGVKGAAGFFALVMLACAALLAGCWWWLSGAPLRGEPSRGWRRVAVVMGRAAVLALVWWLAYAEGWERWVGTVGVFGVAAAGGVAWSRAE